MDMNDVHTYLYLLLDGFLCVGHVSLTLLLICTLSVEPVPMSQTDQVGNGVLIQFSIPLHCYLCVSVSVKGKHCHLFLPQLVQLIT